MSTGAQVDFLVRRDDLHRCTVRERPRPDVAPGEALLRIDAFGLTSNNITYAVMGDALSYWSFFPAEDGWGRLPVWGFAEVVDSAHAQLPAGARVFGFLPPSTHLIVAPGRVDDRGFVEQSERRQPLPPAYNSYSRVDTDPDHDASGEDLQMLLKPLFFLSFLIDDYLDENAFFGADAVVLTSASSKAAIGTAHLLTGRARARVIGLTARKRLRFVRELGVYHDVLAYDELDALPAARSLLVDLAGDGALRAEVHNRYGHLLAHSCVAGGTHWEGAQKPSRELQGPRPSFLFAPDRIRKRTHEWGRAEFESRLAAAWSPFVQWCAEWLRVEHGRGRKAVESAYHEVLGGSMDPATAHALAMSA